jgi:hypothetical protein
MRLLNFQPSRKAKKRGLGSLPIVGAFSSGLISNWGPQRRATTSFPFAERARFPKAPCPVCLCCLPQTNFLFQDARTGDENPHTQHSLLLGAGLLFAQHAAPIYSYMLMPTDHPDSLRCAEYIEFLPIQL